MKFIKVKDLKYAKPIYEINNDALSRKYSVNVKKIKFKNHLRWLKKNINNKNKKIYLTEINNNIVGLVRIEKIKKNSFKISWAIAKKYRRRKYGKNMLKAFVNKFKGNYIAKIKNINYPSLKMSRFAGFVIKNSSTFIHSSSLDHPCLLIVHLI